MAGELWKAKKKQQQLMRPENGLQQFALLHKQPPPCHAPLSTIADSLSYATPLFPLG